ncbi:TIGR01620 family protein [Paracoccus suum]|uniref:TIGR01620 family protein n=1 Tax=Paracoccus suum TaxID=2259340 RepID=A0A344PIR9_9RHOB|nr:TIGR01620 family protein [Paracoccus suum]AXC49274.1 TIGR01620 family protein [Paracoccus suum]
MSDTSRPGPPKRRGPLLVPLDGPGRAPIPPRGPREPGTSPAFEPRAPEEGPQVRPAARAAPSPADAPPIDDGPTGLPSPRAMEMVARIAGREPPAAVKLFINAGGALLTFLLSVAALRFIDDLMTRYPLLGWIGVVLFALFTLATLLLALREYLAFSRLRRIDAIHRQAALALAQDDLRQARSVAEALEGLYAGRPEMARARQRVSEARLDSYDTQTLMSVAETELLAPLDQQARREIEAASRTVAAATALIPLALADVAAALFANLRMIRRMAEIYGGRAGAVGGWRLARTVMTHLVATGAVSAGDDLIHTVAGGGALAKLSRRFGEGVVNGALTARVGIAAMEVCRPLPFIHQPRPRVTNLVGRGLQGLFGSRD